MKSQITETVINALGNPNFDSEKVFEALQNIEHNGSTTALLNVLPELEKLAKRYYLESRGRKPGTPKTGGRKKGTPNRKHPAP